MTTAFEGLAAAAATAGGMPDLPVVVLPHPFGVQPDERVRELAELVLARLVGETP